MNNPHNRKPRKTYLGPRELDPMTRISVKPGGENARGSKKGIRIVDGGPYHSDDWAELFRTLSTEDLASAWVGVLVDSLSNFHKVPPGAIARALIIVAERLHGATCPTELHLNEAHMNGSENRQLASRPTGVEGITKGVGIPPPRSGARGRKSDLLLQIEALQDNDWIQIDPTKIKKGAVSSAVSKVRKERNLGTRLLCYTAGEMIIVRLDPA